jgi:hypothetical protein
LLSAAFKAGPEASPTLLDTAEVRRLYMDGEFDQAIDRIETSLRHGKGHTHEDSVFAFKHLGVMYAARYETREKGKRYMYQLLSVEPTARILDMYASDMIYMIFKNIKDEFDATRGNPDLAGGPTQGRPGGNSGNPGGGKPQPEKSKDRKTGWSKAGYWIGAGVLAAGAAAAWFILSEEKPPKTNIIE